MRFCPICRTPCAGSRNAPQKKQGIERLRALEKLEVQTAFDLHLFRRI